MTEERFLALLDIKDAALELALAELLTHPCPPELLDLIARALDSKP